MGRLLVLGILAAIPASALAQDSTIQCNTWGNQTNCNTHSLDAPPASDGSFERGMDSLSNAIRERRERQAARKREQQAVQYRQAREAMRSEVVGRLRAGDCLGAERTALDANDIELAGQVRTYCAAPPAK